MPTEMHWYDSGTWKKAQQMFGWDSGLSQWREAIRVYIWDGSNWKLCHENACFTYSAEPISSMSDCGTALNFTYSSNCADPPNEAGSITCYLYSDATCSSGVGNTFTQIQVGAASYNVDTDGSSVITNIVPIPC